MEQDLNTAGVNFLQGLENISSDNPIHAIKQKMGEFTSIKNLNVLLGAGASSDAIPNMKTLYKEIKASIEKKEEFDREKELFIGIKKKNLEDILNILYAKLFYLESSSEEESSRDSDSGKSEIESVSALISHIQNEMFKKININLDDEEAKKALEIYKGFYKKVANRSKDLSRINIFTTNNDLLNERSFDDLNINVNDGFGGNIEQVFNPARFRYTYSRKVDLNLDKFEPIENVVYLYKLHGSINWIEKNSNSLFNIHKIPVEGKRDSDMEERVLIYPTPLKQTQSLDSPYSDLIREFQNKMSLPNSVLLIIGYSFNDSHLNNIIYQSLATNSSVSIVIFGEHPKCPLSTLGDPRIYRIFGEHEGKKVHYFNFIVENLLPTLDEDEEKEMLERFASSFSESFGKGMDK